MKEGQLIEVALAEVRWADDAQWALYGDWDLSQIAEEEAENLRQQVISGALNINDLRAGVAWANALDREAFEQYGSDLRTGDQVAERTARRLMHLAGRSALNGLRNSRLRTLAQVELGQYSGGMPGMGKLETHDFTVRDEANLVQ